MAAKKVYELSKDTIKKLRWLQKRVVSHPHKYDQGEWCGTTGCLAGFCFPKALGFRNVVVDDAEYFKSNPAFVEGMREFSPSLNPIAYSCFYQTAKKYLGLDDDSAVRLFHYDWDGKAYEFNRRAGDTDEQAALKAADRIELFIESGGRY